MWKSSAPPPTIPDSVGRKAEAIEQVKGDGRALQFASEVLKNDHEVALAAVKQHRHALDDVSRELQRDRGFRRALKGLEIK